MSLDQTQINTMVAMAAAIGAAVAAHTRPPPSPPHTRVPRDGASVVDKNGVTWTKGPGADGLDHAIRDGVITQGKAVAISNGDGTHVYVLSPTGARWWEWKAAGANGIDTWAGMTTADPG